MEIAAQTSIMVDEVFDDHGCEVVNGSGSLTLNKAQYVSSGCDSCAIRLSYLARVAGAQSSGGYRNMRI